MRFHTVDLPPSTLLRWTCRHRPSCDGPAAIDDDDLTGDVVRGVGGEKYRDALELAGCAHARDRAERLDARLGERNRRVRQPRVEEARRDRVHANPLASP